MGEGIRMDFQKKMRSSLKFGAMGVKPLLWAEIQLTEVTKERKLQPERARPGDRRWVLTRQNLLRTELSTSKPRCFTVIEGLVFSGFVRFLYDTRPGLRLDVLSTSMPSHFISFSSWFHLERTQCSSHR